MSWRVEDSGEAGEGGMLDFDALPVSRGAPRPATILKVADELERRGGEVLELFREVQSPVGRAVFPIHLRGMGGEYFVEVETGSWEPQIVRGVLARAAVLRSSASSGGELRVLGAYPVPQEVRFLARKVPAALLQLDLISLSAAEPEDAAESFRLSAGRRWGTELEYSVEYLPLAEELLLAAFDADEEGRRPPVLDGLVRGLGSFLGETIRRSATVLLMWREDEEWGDVLENGDLTLDPLGKSRAFLENGAEDSIAFYARFVLGELSN